MAGKENKWSVLGDSGIVNFGAIDMVRQIVDQLNMYMYSVYMSTITCNVHVYYYRQQCDIHVYWHALRLSNLQWYTVHIYMYM